MTVRALMRPEADFNRVARVYRWAEYLLLGTLLKRTREQFLPRLVQAKRALALGDGDGRFTAALVLQNRQIQVTALDSSSRMLRLLVARCARVGASHRVQVYTLGVENIADLLTGPPFDLVVSHFFLDCLTQPELNRLVHRISATLDPGARWLVSDFALPVRMPWRLLGWLYVRGLYLVFGWLTGLRVTSLPDPSAALRASGFQQTDRYTRLKGLLYTELWQLHRPRQTAGSVSSS